MAGRIHSIDIVHTDFDRIARCTDEEVYQQMVFACRSTKQRLIPKRIRWTTYRVSRDPDAVRLHLLLAKDRVTEPKEVARFGFVRGPDFSGITR